MRALSEMASTMVLIAVTLAAVTGVLSYYGRSMGDAWFALQKEVQLEEYVSGVKIAAFRKNGCLWLYNYGWNEAYIESVENAGNWSLVDAVTGEAISSIPPKRLALLLLENQQGRIVIRFKGGVRVEA